MESSTQRRRTLSGAPVADAPDPADTRTREQALPFTPAERTAMQRALELAATPGVPTGPNPRVGCVILADDGTEVAEGFHRGSGTPHAEADALSKAGDDARGATAVVTLEPCSHSGRTGPCAEALIAAGVRRVVFAQSDTNPVARGGGASLRAAGIEVEAGLLLDEARALNHAWTFAVEHGRPFVTWKFATTLDGRSAAADGTSRWVSSLAARRDTHRLRAECDAVLVGSHTVEVDDPELTVRDELDQPVARQPLRVVVGERSLAADRRIFNDRAETLQLRTRDPHEVLAALFARDCQHVVPRGRTDPGGRLPRGRPGRPGRRVRRADAARVRGHRRRRPRHRHHRRRPPSPCRRRPGAPRLCLRRRGCRGHQHPADHDSHQEDRLMFTGIVEELGTVAALEDQGDAARLSIRAGRVLEDVTLGDSIAVNGCCLTVTAVADGVWTADVMQETLDKTSLRGAAVGDRVNLERAATLATRLGGHLVQGHVDGVGEILSRSASDHSVIRWEVVTISLPTHLAPYVVDKGSIAVDGVSLTVVEAAEDHFTVSLIPETLSRTTLGSRAPGDRVNLEVDVIAKHVAKLVRAYTGGEG